jgi:hypothetical protein
MQETTALSIEVFLDYQACQVSVLTHQIPGGGGSGGDGGGGGGGGGDDD